MKSGEDGNSIQAFWRTEAAHSLGQKGWVIASGATMKPRIWSEKALYRVEGSKDSGGKAKMSFAVDYTTLWALTSSSVRLDHSVWLFCEGFCKTGIEARRE